MLKELEQLRIGGHTDCKTTQGSHPGQADLAQFAATFEWNKCPCCTRFCMEALLGNRPSRIYMGHGSFSMVQKTEAFEKHNLTYSAACSVGTKRTTRGRGWDVVGSGLSGQVDSQWSCAWIVDQRGRRGARLEAGRKPVEYVHNQLWRDAKLPRIPRACQGSHFIRKARFFMSNFWWDGI